MKLQIEMQAERDLNITPHKVLLPVRKNRMYRFFDRKTSLELDLFHGHRAFSRPLVN